MDIEGQNRECGRWKESGTRAARVYGFGRWLSIQLPVKGLRALRVGQGWEIRQLCVMTRKRALSWNVRSHGSHLSTRKEGTKE